MIKSLSDITMKDFISLLCGEYGVLLEEGEHADKDKLRETASDLAYKYRMITSPAQARSALYEVENDVKYKSRLLLVQILQTMHAMGNDDEVRSLLAEVGRVVDDSRISGTLDSMHAECLYLIRKNEDMRPHHKARTPEEIRESFDAETAMLMTFFKMQINTGEISAGVYANMLRQADEQIRRMNKRV